MMDPLTDDDRWTLTQRGWCEALGISSAAAEVLESHNDVEPAQSP